MGSRRFDKLYHEERPATNFSKKNLTKIIAEQYMVELKSEMTIDYSPSQKTILKAKNLLTDLNYKYSQIEEIIAELFRTLDQKLKFEQDKITDEIDDMEAIQNEIVDMIEEVEQDINNIKLSKDQEHLNTIKKRKEYRNIVKNYPHNK